MDRITTAATEVASEAVVTTSHVGTDSSGGSSDTVVTSTGSMEASTFIPVPDHGGDPVPCDTLAQDCPPGQKCTYYAEGGGSSWNAMKCVPVMENPAGPDEPCFVVGNGVSGIDNCDKGLMCWNTDAVNTGTCSPLCAGSWEMLMCPSGWTVGWARAGFCICAEKCDPLASNCEDGEVCLGAYDGFFCWYHDLEMDAQTHEPCEFGLECASGLLCIDSMSALECDPVHDGCCEPFCDLNKPNTCPGQDQVCNPYFAYFHDGPTPPGYEHVGVCAVPM